MLNSSQLTTLIRFWQKHLRKHAYRDRMICGDYQQISSAAYNQIKHLAALHAALPPASARKSRPRR